MDALVIFILFIDNLQMTFDKYENESTIIETDNIPEKIFVLKKDILKFGVNSVVLDAIFKAPHWDWVSFLRKDRKEMQDKITDYIIWWNLGTQKNPIIENQILRFSKYSRKLKYLLDNSNVSLEENIKNIVQIDEKNKSLVKNANKLWSEGGGSLVKKWWEWLKGSVKWIISHFVNLTDVPKKLWVVFGDMLARAEELIWKSYVRGSMDCSMFLSKIFCAWQWIKEERLGRTSDFSKYPRIASNDIRCWDVMYQASPAHVELVVGKPYVENGVTYVTTIWSSTDTNKVDPMFDANWNPIKGKTWVWYRKRRISPNPRHTYTYHRPPYNQWAENRI